MYYKNLINVKFIFILTQNNNTHEINEIQFVMH